MCSLSLKVSSLFVQQNAIKSKLLQKWRFSAWSLWENGVFGPAPPFLHAAADVCYENDFLCVILQRSRLCRRKVINSREKLKFINWLFTGKVILVYRLGGGHSGQVSRHQRLPHPRVRNFYWKSTVKKNFPLDLITFLWD